MTPACCFESYSNMFQRHLKTFLRIELFLRVREESIEHCLYLRIRLVCSIATEGRSMGKTWALTAGKRRSTAVSSCVLPLMIRKTMSTDKGGWLYATLPSR